MFQERAGRGQSLEPDAYVGGNPRVQRLTAAQIQTTEIGKLQHVGENGRSNAEVFLARGVRQSKFLKRLRVLLEAYAEEGVGCGLILVRLRDEVILWGRALGTAQTFGGHTRNEPTARGKCPTPRDRHPKG